MGARERVGIVDLAARGSQASAILACRLSPKSEMEKTLTKTFFLFFGCAKLYVGSAHSFDVITCYSLLDNQNKETNKNHHNLFTKHDNEGPVQWHHWGHIYNEKALQSHKNEIAIVSLICILGVRAWAAYISIQHVAHMVDGTKNVSTFTKLNNKSLKVVDESFTDEFEF